MIHASYITVNLWYLETMSLTQHRFIWTRFLASQGHVGREISYNIKLHYRFIDPDFLQRITNPRQMYIVDPSVAETATMASPTDDTKRVLLAGDVSLPTPPGSSYPQVMYRVMRDLGKATGLEVRFTATGTRENWMWAVFAECSLLSQRVTTSDWPMKEGNLESGD